MVTKEYFDELTESMAKQSVESLVEDFNKQVGSRAWTSIRGLHDSVLIDTLIAKVLMFRLFMTALRYLFREKSL